MRELGLTTEAMRLTSWPFGSTSGVAVHPFPNGNGRHARLMADLLVVKLGGERFSWGSVGATASIADAGLLRSPYVDALRRADRHDLVPLIAFARS